MSLSHKKIEILPFVKTLVDLEMKKEMYFATEVCTS